MTNRNPIRVAILAAWLSLGADALQSGFQLEDRIDVFQVDRRLIAFNTKTGEPIEVTLERGERVLSLHNEGLMGFVATNVRLLGVSIRSDNWEEIRYRVMDRNRNAPDQLHVEDRVILVALPTRLVAFSATIPRWAELELGPKERILNMDVDTNVAAVLTQRRAIGFSAKKSGFAEIKLTPREAVESFKLEENSIRIVTSRRVLLFRSDTKLWTDLLRKDKS